MEKVSTKDRVMAVKKDGELLAVLDGECLYTVDLHCEEIALVWYALLSMADAA